MIVADFNDIVFANHNKIYGAYILRKRYSRVLCFSIFAASVAFSILFILAFFQSPRKGREIVRTVQYVVMENLAPPTDQVLLNPPPPPPPPSGTQMLALTEKSTKYIAPQVVDSVVPQQFIQEKINSGKDSIDSKITGDYGVSNGTGSGLGMHGGTGTGDYYISAEVMPTFKGGDIGKFREWVMKKTKYPQFAMTNNIEGKVYISFIVEHDGTVSNVIIVKGVDASIDNEAKKVVASSPKWVAGKMAGNPVRVKYVIAIDFRL